MSQMNDLRRALYEDDTPSRHAVRAARTRAEALAPGRILLSLVTLPGLAVCVALSIYIRTSEFDPPDALAHLVARANCDAARSIGLAPSYRGALGYHARNDPDGDGVACEVFTVTRSEPVQEVVFSAPAEKPRVHDQRLTGAKFVRPSAE